MQKGVIGFVNLNTLGIIVSVVLMLFFIVLHGSCIVAGRSCCGH